MDNVLLWLALPSLLPACVDPVRFPTDGGATDTEAVASTGGGTDERSQETGSPEPSPGDESSGSATGDSGDSTCDPQTHACVAAAPGLWNGPFARTVGDAGCSGAYPSRSSRTHQGVYAPPAECACACQPAAGGACSDNATIEEFVEFGGVNVDGCDVATGTYEGVDEFPMPVGPFEADARYRIERPAVEEAGDCAPIVLEDSIPPSQKILPLQTCEPAEALEACDANTVCAPIPGEGFSAQLCLWTEGDAACPDAYPEKTLTGTDVEDTRGCEPCQCGSAQGERCDDAEGFAWFTPGFVPAAYSANGGCQAVDTPDGASIIAVSYEGGAPTGGSCEPVGDKQTGGEATGRAQITGHVTVCCQAELPE